MFTNLYFAQSVGDEEYTASQQRGKTPPTSVQDMTVNNLIVRVP